MKINHLPSHRTLLALGVSLAGGFSTAIHAQESPQARGIEEVIVTATRREQSLQDVPISVSALSADELTVRNVRTLAEIEPGTIPGVLFNTFTNTPSMLQVSIRGNGTSDGGQGILELPVPIYLDGVYLGRSQGSSLELIDPQRIEVLRGPQGQLFGRNAEGGAVQYVSRKPTGEFGVRASASFGNYALQRYRLSMDLPEIAGISATISGVTVDQDGFTDNVDTIGQDYVPPPPTHDYGGLDTEGYRIALRWQSDNEDVTIDYSYDNTDQFDTQAYNSWVATNIGTPANSLLPPSTDFPDESLMRLHNPGFDVYAKGHALTVEWQVSDNYTLKSISSYRESGRTGGNTLGTALPAGRIGLASTTSEDVEAEQTSQELQFIGTWERFDLTAGAIYFNEEVRDIRITRLSGPLASAFFGRDPAPVSESDQRAETDSYGLYAQGSYRPAPFEDKLELTLGLRYSDDTKEGVRTSSNFVPVNIPLEFSEERVDPAVSVRYEWTDTLSTYIRYATGYRAGGSSVRSPSFRSYEAEESEQWELGLKSQLADGRIRLNAAVYENTIKSEQLTIQTDPIGNPALVDTFSAPFDKVVKGLELELLWATTDSLDLGLNFSYMDVKDIEAAINPFDPTGNTTTLYWAINTPEHSGSVFADYQQGLPLGSLRLYASYAWADDFYSGAGAQNTNNISPDYKRPAQKSSQLTARLSWQEIPVGAGNVAISLWGRNLEDDAGIVYGFEGCALGGGYCTYRTNPRTYGVEVEYTY